MTARSVLTTGRGQFGLLLLAIAAGIVAFMGYYATNAPAPVVTDTHQDATIYYTADRPGVFFNDGCVNLRWRLSDITEVYLNDVPTVGEQVEKWCLPPPATYRGFYRDPARPELRVRFADGEIRRYTLPVYVMQPFAVRMVLPLVLVALVVIGSLYLPGRITQQITKPRAIPPVWVAWFERVRWRRWATAALISGAMVTLLVAAYRVTLAPPHMTTFTAGDAALTVTLDPPAVFNGCTRLSWEATNTQHLTLDEREIPAQGATEWCLPPRASNSIPQFEFTAGDGSTHRRTVMIRALLPVLYVTALPMLVIAGLLWVPFGWLDRCAAHPLMKPFAHGGKINRVLLALFVGVNVLAVSNMVRHNSELAYDAEDHFLYSVILSQGRLPTEAETNQFFAPPLAYVFPSLVHRAAAAFGVPPCTEHTGSSPACQITAKSGQLQNIIAIVGITYLLVLICGIIRPQDAALTIHALGLLAMLPVTYKALVFQRGEPFVALFTLLTVHRLLIMLPTDRKPTLRDALIFGLGTGLLVLSRQWGVLAALGMATWALVMVIRRRSAPLLRTGLLAYAVALVSGGWFYLFTRWRLGSVTAFNRAPEVASKPLEFFIGMGSGTLFSEPFRSARIAQILPIFYTDLWGDYWGHFHLPNADFSVWTAEPPPGAIAYMAQVNIVSLFPTLILLCGLGFGVVQAYNWLRWGRGAAFALLQLVIVASLAGYLWFLASYPHSVGDTIKTAYMLHVFPLVAILSGAVLVRLRGWLPLVYVITIIALAIIAAHNILVAVTQYTGKL